MRHFLFVLSAVLLCVDCNGDKNTDQSDLPDQTDQTEISDGANLSDADVVPPTFLSLSVAMNPNEAAPLVGVVTARTDPATRLRVNLESTDDKQTIRYSPLTSEHRFPILGLLPGHTYTVTVTAETEEGGVATYPQTFTLVTPSLPSAFPSIQHLSRGSDAIPEPGYRFTAIQPQNTDQETTSLLAAFDETGRIRWFRSDPDLQHGMYPLPDGNILLQFGIKIIEVDIWGDIVGEWRPEQDENGGPLAVKLTGVARFHHSVAATPANTIVTLDDDFRTLENYPTSDTDPNAPKDTVTVCADTIVEFARDGTSVRMVRLLDVLDPYRFGYELIPGYHWSHANAVRPVAEDDSLVVSVRNQSCLIKIDRTSGALHWILGNHQNWDPSFAPFLLTPVGEPFAWQWYQHSPIQTPQGTILIFDNGNFKAMPFDPPIPNEENWSRVVEYRINEAAMTVEQVWEWFPDETPRLFSRTISSVTYLPKTGNILVVFDNVPDPETPPGNEVPAITRIFEVTHTLPAHTISEIRIGTTATSIFSRPSLYPEGMVEE